MLANDPAAAVEAIQAVQQQSAHQAGELSCHICGLSGLDEDGLHLHVPMYHSMQPEANSIQPTHCPLCQIPQRDMERNNFYLHLHNAHGPEASREPHFPDSNAFTWVVCRRPSDGRFLMV